MMRSEVLRSRSVLLAALALLFLAVGALAQLPAARTPPEKPNRFILSAVDEDGSPVADLTAQELEVKSGTRALRVNGLTRFHDAPIRIVIVFDESSSMVANWRAALRIVSELLHSLPPNSHVALVGVNSGTPELIETPGAIARYLHNRSRRGAGGWTKLWDHIHIALLALPNPRPTDVIFVVSDGVDNASKLSFHELQEEVHAAQVRVSGAILVDMLAATPSTRIVSPELGDLMRETGGWNLTVSPFLRRREAGGRFERSHVESPNLPGFLATLFDFYYVDLLPEAIALPRGPLAVRALGTRKNTQRILLSAPQRPPTP